MTDPQKPFRKLRAVIEFLAVERENAENIHRKFYRKAALDVRSWVSRVNCNPREKKKLTLETGTTMAGQLLLQKIRLNRLMLV